MGSWVRDMVNNGNLYNAKIKKNDEFYTQLEDIEKELCHYTEHFKNKVVYCNCDNPEQSMFWKYFYDNFHSLGLKKLVATYYDTYTTVYKTTYDGNEIKKEPLHCNGDFQNKECIDILDGCDIVVTNPPFSLFRAFVSTLIEHDKQFLIIGNINAITYKEIFPLILENRLWFGCRSLNKDMYFNVTNEYKDYLVTHKKENSAYKTINGVIMGRLASACWYTNIEHNKRNKIVTTTYLYYQTPYLYQKYDNYDAIHVEKVAEIPMDYDGIMGVPITFLEKYNPEQFTIIGLFNHGSDGPYDLAKPIINGKERFKRIAIKKRTV